MMNEPKVAVIGKRSLSDRAPLPPGRNLGPSRSKQVAVDPRVTFFDSLNEQRDCQVRSIDGRRASGCRRSASPGSISASENPLVRVTHTGQSDPLDRRRLVRDLQWTGPRI